MEWYIMAWSKAADFTGRARRSEYWYFQLFNALVFLALIALGVILRVTGGAVQTITIPCSLYSLICFIPSLSCTVRRLHDTGRSGWWYCISFLPLIGAVILLVFLVTDSEPGWNAYGHNPKVSDYGSAVI
jgi:uncharacterized membrane protein YhaH (DUF805 family)